MDNKNKELLDAVRENNLHKVQELHKMGADVNYEREGSGSTPLYFAVINNFLDIADFLLRNGADINHHFERGETVLHIIAEEENIDMLQLFLKHHPKINAKDKFRNNPLWTACYSNNLEIIELLLQHGAEPYSMNRVGEILVGKKKEPMGVSISPYGAAIDDDNKEQLALFEKYKNHE